MSAEIKLAQIVSALEAAGLECLVMDGQRGPAYAELVWPIFSPDGTHWAYYAKKPTPDQQPYTVVDGKVADYHAGRLRYTPDLPPLKRTSRAGSAARVSTGSSGCSRLT